MSSKSQTQNPLFHPLLFLYQVLQWLLNAILSPRPPRSGTVLRRPKVAIIGAGITGVSSAAHCVGHGFDVVIFEAGDKSQLGGIWSVSSRFNFLYHEIMLTTRKCRESMILQACRFILSCIASTLLSAGNVAIPTGSRSSVKSASSGNATAWRTRLGSTPRLTKSTKTTKVDGLSTTRPMVASMESLPRLALAVIPRCRTCKEWKTSRERFTTLPS